MQQNRNKKQKAIQTKKMEANGESKLNQSMQPSQCNLPEQNIR